MRKTMSESEQTSSRKLDHVRIVLGEDVAAKGVTTGIEHPMRSASSNLVS